MWDEHLYVSMCVMINIKPCSSEKSRKFVRGKWHMCNVDTQHLQCVYLCDGDDKHNTLQQRKRPEGSL